LDRDRPPDEQELVRRAQGKDESALRTLFERNGDELRARVLSRMPSLARGKISQSDVVQEAYLTAFERLGSFESRSTDGFRRWLLRIVEFKVREEIRRWIKTEKRAALREVRITDAPGGAVPLSPGPSPATAAGEVDERVRLQAALDHLSEPDRTILGMVHQQGLTYPEAGERLGISPDAARMRHGRALARLGRLTRGETHA